MTIESLLMQYQSECLKALKSTAIIRKPFEKVFMDAMKLFMAIPYRHLHAFLLASPHHPDLGNGRTVKTRRQSPGNCSGCHLHEQSCRYVLRQFKHRRQILHQLRSGCVRTSQILSGMRCQVISGKRISIPLFHQILF